MDELFDHIESKLRTYPIKRIILACSGGLDSTVLAHLCHRTKFPIELAHVNYQLRGAASEKDAAFVKELAASLDAPFHLKKCALHAQLQDGGNLQELARKVRYDFFESLRNADIGTFVLLAHHAEDQTETFFMNLARNSGIMGLAAMPERRGQYLRPLLEVSKEDLRIYATVNNISWCEDQSNEQLKYTRNRWRNVILPELRASIPTLDQSISMLVGAFQETQKELEKRIHKIVQDIQVESVLKVTTFQSMDIFEKVELCRQLGQSPKLIDTWNKLERKGAELLLKQNGQHVFADKIVFNGDVYAFVSNSFDRSIVAIPEVIKKLPTTFNKNSIYLDADRIQGTLLFRKHRKGERIHPIGMSGSRLISDVISDAKLNAHQKEMLFILADEAHVLWVPGLSVSRKAIATAKSKTILKVSENLVGE